ncbi:peptidoglycan DD-metalloendopeptidase family protein [Mucilaginibacter puniceus]
MRFLKIVLLIVCVFTAVNVHAQSSAELKRQRERINEELQKLNRELQDVQNNKNVTLKQLNLIKRKISAREEKIKIINTEVRNLDNQISENTGTVRSLQSQLDQLKKEYAGMVLFAYHNQSAYNKLMFIFAAEDFNQAYKRLKYLQQFATYRERQAGYIESTKKELNGKIVQLGKTKEEKHSLLVDQQKEKEKLGKERNGELKTVEKLTRAAGLLQKRQKEAQVRLSRVNKAVNDAIRREVEEERRKAEEQERLAAAARAKSGSKEPAAKPVSKRTTSEILNATPEAAKLSSDFLSNKGQLPWPVANGEVLHGFGAYFIEGIRMDNNGLEIKTNPGAAVRAVFSGEVTLVTDMGGAYVVVIKHGEYFTSYYNLRSTSVSVGQKVSTKQSVGIAAVDEISGDTSIIFSLSKGTTAVNPSIWLAPDK